MVQWLGDSFTFSSWLNCNVTGNSENIESSIRKDSCPIKVIFPMRLFNLSESCPSGYSDGFRILKAISSV